MNKLSDLLANVIGDLTHLVVIKKLDVVNRLLPQLIALLVTQGISLGVGCVELGPTGHVHLKQVLDLGVAQRAWLSGNIL